MSSYGQQGQYQYGQQQSQQQASQPTKVDLCRLSTRLSTMASLQAHRLTLLGACDIILQGYAAGAYQQPAQQGYQQQVRLAAAVSDKSSSGLRFELVREACP